MTDTESYIQSVLQSRGTDTVVHFSAHVLSDFRFPTSLDAFVAQFGFGSACDQWREISREDSAHLLARVLKSDLAYLTQLMDSTLATKLANQFTDYFGAGSRFFTNGTFHTGSDSPEWMPISDYTFETGVVALDTTCMAILWVRDED